jgi:hypothetical protein
MERVLRDYHSSAAGIIMYVFVIKRSLSFNLILKKDKSTKKIFCSYISLEKESFILLKVERKDANAGEMYSSS